MRLMTDLEPCELLLKAYVPEGVAFKASVKRGKPSLEGYNFTHNESAFPVDGYHLLGAIARAEGLKQGLHSTHSACIGGHLLVGHSGAGKTSVLVELLALGVRGLVGTNKTLLCKNLIAHGGTKAITFEAGVHPAPKGHKAYGSRIAYMPEAGVIESKPQKVQNIWFIKLNDDAVNASKLAPLSAAHRLYPFMMDKVNADVMLCEGALHFSVDDALAGKALAANLAKALEGKNVYQISGSRKAIAAYIKEHDYA